MNKLETYRTDQDGDGTFDHVRTITYTFAGDKLETRSEAVTNTLYGVSHGETTSYGYDAVGNTISESHQSYWDDGNRSDSQWWIERAFDSGNRVVTEKSISPDMDGDGQIGDYGSATGYVYDDAGRLTLKHRDSTYDGEPGPPGDYTTEKWTYDAAGRLASYSIDNPGPLDCIISKFYNYNRWGQLATIKDQNEIRYHDERPRIDESFTYDKSGNLKTHTDWADYSDKGWFQRVDTAYTWKAGYDMQFITYDKEGDWKPEAKKVVENWYNSDGNLTHTLVSHDDDGKGGHLPGGFDRRDLFVKIWDGDTMISETQDFDIHDGVVEYSFTSELLVA